MSFYGIILFMKLSTYAKEVGINYKTAWRYYRQGLLKGYQLPTGTIIIEESGKNTTKYLSKKGK